VWSFNSTIESWAFWPSAGTGALTWTGAVGNPGAGALSLDITSGSGLYGWIVMDGPAANLTGRTGSVWLWLDTVTTGVGAKLYVQTNNPSYSWADGGFVNITPRTWTCLSIDLSSPAYQDQQYDPASILRFGVELVGPGPVRFYADQFSY
jgi:hypothetical protein